MSDESGLSEDEFYINPVESNKNRVEKPFNAQDASNLWKSKVDCSEMKFVSSPLTKDPIELENDLSNAITKGDTKGLLTILDLDPDFVNMKLSPSFGSSSKRPIFFAAEEGRPEVVSLLLDIKCDLSPEDGQFYPLMSACSSTIHDREKELGQCARILLKQKDVNVNACQAQKITALMLASKHGHTEVVEALLECPDIDLDAQDSQKWTGRSVKELVYFLCISICFSSSDLRNGFKKWRHCQKIAGKGCER